MYIQVPKIFWTFWKKEKNSWNFREELEHYTKSIFHFPYTEHGLCFSCFHWYHCFLHEFICSWSCAGHQGFPWEWIQGCILIQWCSTGMLLCWLEDLSGQMVLFNPVSALSLCLPPSLPHPSVCPTTCAWTSQSSVYTFTRRYFFYSSPVVVTDARLTFFPAAVTQLRQQVDILSSP